MRIHLEVTRHDPPVGDGTLGWSAWVDIVHDGDRRECVWSRGGTKLRPLVQAGLEELILRGDADDIDRLRRRNAELEIRLAERTVFIEPGYHLTEHTFVDGLCACGAIEDRSHRA